TEGSGVESHLGISALLGAHHEGAEDGAQGSAARDHEGQDHGADAGSVGHGCSAHSEHHDANDGPHVGLEQVGAHARHVTDVVADVVGNHGWVTRVVFGQPTFDLADEV